MRFLLVAAALAAATANAGMYDQPYAIVERGSASEVRREATVGLISIDGASTRDSRRTDPLPPGKHTITLRFQSARGRFKPEYTDLDLDLQPCTRYRIVAGYQSTMGPDWKPVVYTEPIGECRKKFGLKK